MKKVSRVRYALAQPPCSVSGQELVVGAATGGSVEERLLGAASAEVRDMKPRCSWLRPAIFRGKGPLTVRSLRTQARRVLKLRGGSHLILKADASLRKAAAGGGAWGAGLAGLGAGLGQQGGEGVGLQGPAPFCAMGPPVKRKVGRPKKQQQQPLPQQPPDAGGPSQVTDGAPPPADADGAASRKRKEPEAPVHINGKGTGVESPCPQKKTEKLSKELLSLWGVTPRPKTALAGRLLSQSQEEPKAPGAAAAGGRGRGRGRGAARGRGRKQCGALPNSAPVPQVLLPDVIAQARYRTPSAPFASSPTASLCPRVHFVLHLPHALKCVRHWAFFPFRRLPTGLRPHEPSLGRKAEVEREVRSSQAHSSQARSAWRGCGCDCARHQGGKLAQGGEPVRALWPTVMRRGAAVAVGAVQAAGCGGEWPSRVHADQAFDWRPCPGELVPSTPHPTGQAASVPLSAVLSCIQSCSHYGLGMLVLHAIFSR